MVPIKTLLTGLAGFSLCTANISGTVTDTGTTPISGAVVQLEKGGQTATTESDGRFTIMVSTAVLPVNSTLLPNGLSARISNTMLTMTIPDGTAVEVTTFDLNGKALSTVRRPMDAGTHSIALPYRGAGIYLYKVKAGNNEFVLKGNTAARASSGNVASFQSSSSNSPAKQAKVTAAINDVIAVTKTGYLNYRVVAYNSDTSGIQIKMIASAGTVTDMDGNVYQTVRIGNQVWTVENLRVTKYNDGSSISLDTSTTTWNNDTTPRYCFYHNMTNSGGKKKYGALYNWYVVCPANPRKIAPTGWHVPSDAEWDSLQNYLIANSYNWNGMVTGNKTAKSLAAKTDWWTYEIAGTIGCDLAKNNTSGFSALAGGYRDFIGRFNYQDSIGYWWSATKYDASYAWLRNLWYDFVSFNRGYTYKSCGISVRIVLD